MEDGEGEADEAASGVDGEAYQLDRTGRQGPRAQEASGRIWEGTGTILLLVKPLLNLTRRLTMAAGDSDWARDMCYGRPEQGADSRARARRGAGGGEPRVLAEKLRSDLSRLPTSCIQKRRHLKSSKIWRGMGI